MAEFYLFGQFDKLLLDFLRTRMFLHIENIVVRLRSFVGHKPRTPENRI